MSDAPGLGRYPWVAMVVVLTGAYMVILNLTILGVALPDIAGEIGGVVGVDWVVTAYAVSVGLVQPGTGWLADRWGKKRVFVVALVVFAGGSLLAGLAPSLGLLIAARIVQGMGGGLMMPVGMAIVYELFPPERRGLALGVWGVAMMAAPAVGPPLGGWLTSTVSWRWIFLVNIPIGVLGFVLASRYLRDVGFRERRPLDVAGWLLAGIAIATLVGASRLVGSWGLVDPRTLGVFAVGVGLFVVLVVRSLRLEHPVIEFRMFATPAFSISLAVVAFLTVVQFARLTYLPVELQVVRDLEPQQVGLLLGPAALGVAATMTLGGWLADRVGARLPIVTGLVLIAGSTWFIANLTPETPQSTIVALLVVSGVGTGLALMPNTVAAMNSLPTRYVAQASAVRNINREVAGALGTAVLASILVGQLGAVAPENLTSAAELAAAQDAYNDVFMLAFGSLLVALALALFLPGRRQMREFQEARVEEHRELVAQAAQKGPVPEGVSTPGGVSTGR